MGKGSKTNARAKHADDIAVVVKCADYRYSPLTRKQLEKELGVEAFYNLSRLGAGRQLLRKKTRRGLLEEVAFTLSHKAQKIVVIQHEDCGMYGGSSSFANYDEERALQVAHLYQMGGILHAKFPRVPIVLCWHPDPGRGPLEIVYTIPAAA